MGQVHACGQLSSELSPLLLRKGLGLIWEREGHLLLCRVNERAGSRVQVPRSAHSRHRHGGAGGGTPSELGDGPRRKISLSPWTPASRRYGRGRAASQQCLGTQLHTSMCFICLLRAMLGPPPCTTSVNPVQHRWQPGDWLPRSETSPGSPRKRHCFGRFHGFMFARGTPERWLRLEMNSGAQIPSRVFRSKQTS